MPSYAVIANDGQEFDTREAARALAKAKGGVFTDTKRQLHRCCGIIETDVAEELAKRIQADLRVVGVSTFLVPTNKLIEFPPAAKVRAMTFADESCTLDAVLRTKSGPQRMQVQLNWNRVVILASGRAKKTELKRESNIRIQPPRMYAAGVGMGGVAAMAAIEASAAPRRKTREVITQENFLDMLCVEPPAHFRIEADDFKYAALGVKLEPSSYQNFVLLVRRIAQHTTGAHLDKSVELVMDGHPGNDVRVPSLEAYENYLLWRVQLIYYRSNRA